MGLGRRVRLIKNTAPLSLTLMLAGNVIVLVFSAGILYQRLITLEKEVSRGNEITVQNQENIRELREGQIRIEATVNYHVESEFGFGEIGKGKTKK